MLASILITHITDDNLKRMIQAAHPRDGYEAWLLLKTNCYREPNDLALQEMDNMWNDCNFMSVGIDENSINNTIRFLHHLNSRRPAAKQYDEDQIVVKLLGCFSPAICESIAHDAMRELAATPHERRFVHPALPGAPAGSRSTQKLRKSTLPLCPRSASTSWRRLRFSTLDARSRSRVLCLMDHGHEVLHVLERCGAQQPLDRKLHDVLHGIRPLGTPHFPAFGTPSRLSTLTEWTVIL